MTERLKVYLSGIQAGYLTWDSELDVFSFHLSTGPKYSDEDGQEWMLFTVGVEDG